MGASRVGDGEREYFASLDRALEAQQLPLENRPLVREIASKIPYDRIYVPRQSRAYIALVEPDSGKIVAAIHSGYVSIHTSVAGALEDYTLYADTEASAWWWIELPVNSIRDGGQTMTAREPRDHGTCPTCFVALPATGRCDTCD
ncbi:hypothetical protein QQX13_00215 [Demequina sp. SYSU T00068]|uniref:hypothetical protein n=1 Tax=Demequina lignilytica TaxID=3051663 RepID=UPI00260C6665|nr:hypothetical protein [Demequina sp. SYSU T00068]MDN4489247.1 hypothetical protein [Demequina sp. SYSU T00068]